MQLLIFLSYYIMIWLCEWRSRSGQSMPYKTNAKQAGMIAVATAEGLVRAWWHDALVPPPVPFVFGGNPMGVFKGGHMVLNYGVSIGDGWCDWHQGIFFKQLLNFFCYDDQQRAYCMILGRWWFSILEMCSCNFNIMTLMQRIFAFSKTSILVRKLLEWMLRLV